MEARDLVFVADLGQVADPPPAPRVAQRAGVKSGGGAVTSIPSLTRSGRPSASLRSSPPSGSTWAALRVSSDRPIGPGESNARIWRFSCRVSLASSRLHSRGAEFASCAPSSLLLLLSLLGLVSFSFGLIMLVASQVPALDPARCEKQEVDGYVYAAVPHKRVLAVLRGSESRILVPSDEISGRMKQAIVAVEDKRFYVHRGVDLHAIARAVWADVRNEKVVEGGSTLTQQFIKNTCVHSQRSISRKLKEAALAWQLEQRWSKDRILTEYLNTIYYGNGAYGVERASRTYFHHSAKTMTWAEAALLAGISSDPSQFDPVADPKAARARRQIVLHDLLEQGDITKFDYLRASRRPLPNPQDVHLPGEQGPAPYFTNYVKQQLVDRYGSGRVFGGGLRAYTTIDLNVQKWPAARSRSGCRARPAHRRHSSRSIRATGRCSR